MHTRARALIDFLDLRPHPEGGYFRRVYRSEKTVVRTPTQELRFALTTIYFLLVEGEHGAWHRVASDEAWHFYEGAPLELLLSPPDAETMQRRRLGPVSMEAQPVEVVPAGWWQAARTLGSFTLAGCSVAPGFEFDDFILADDLPQDQTWIRTRLLQFGP
jgi:uncharacterized protein